MPIFNVKLTAVTDMSAFIEVEAETAEAAFLAVSNRGPSSKTINDAIARADWEFTDARDALEIEPKEVWDQEIGEVVFPSEDPPDEGKRFIAVRLIDAYARYTAVIEGYDTAEEAWDWVHDYASHGKVPWVKDGYNEYDNSSLGIEDEDGNELIDFRDE